MKRRELELALDRTWTRGGGRTARFTASDLAQTLSIVLGRPVSTADVGQSLQAYRTTSRRRFDVACEGYARSARWRILGVHNHASTRRQEETRQHRDYTLRDSLLRQGRDLVYEVLPALVRNGSGVAECKAECLRHKGECYRVLATSGLDPSQVAEQAEDAFAPVGKWFEESFGVAL